MLRAISLIVSVCNYFPIITMMHLRLPGHSKLHSRVVFGISPEMPKVQCRKQHRAFAASAQLRAEISMGGLRAFGSRQSDYKTARPQPRSSSAALRANSEPPAASSKERIWRNSLAHRPVLALPSHRPPAFGAAAPPCDGRRTSAALSAPHAGSRPAHSGRRIPAGESRRSGSRLASHVASLAAPLRSRPVRFVFPRAHAAVRAPANATAQPGAVRWAEAARTSALPARGADGERALRRRQGLR